MRKNGLKNSMTCWSMPTRNSVQGGPKSFNSFLILFLFEEVIMESKIISIPSLKKEWNNWTNSSINTTKNARKKVSLNKNLKRNIFIRNSCLWKKNSELRKKDLNRFLNSHSKFLNKYPSKNKSKPLTHKIPKILKSKLNDPCRKIRTVEQKNKL